jgi:hypothetical protein
VTAASLSRCREAVEYAIGPRRLVRGEIDLDQGVAGPGRFRVETGQAGIERNRSGMIAAQAGQIGKAPVGRHLPGIKIKGLR